MQFESDRLQGVLIRRKISDIWKYQDKSGMSYARSRTFSLLNFLIYKSIIQAVLLPFSL